MFEYRFTITNNRVKMEIYILAKDELAARNKLTKFLADQFHFYKSVTTKRVKKYKLSLVRYVSPDTSYK